MNNSKETIRIMEVCGTHTHSVARYGIRNIIPKRVKLLSGPGCPVCVTEEAYIDTAIDLLMRENVIIVTFGDMLKVRGTHLSLSEVKSDNVYTVYSPEAAVTLATNNKDKTVVFLAVGFETTAPLIAATIKKAYENGVSNLFFLTSLKRMEPVLRLILEDKRNRIDGIICPGHVATVIGSEAFAFITDEFRIPAAICGFGAEDITYCIYHLLGQISGIKPVSFTNLYERYVSSSGNKLARQYLEEVFETANGNWRGIGQIASSALVINEKYKGLDACCNFGIAEKIQDNPTACRCSEIILGIKNPNECNYFGKSCTPDNPLGPCMVSSEGACAAYYKYRRG